MHIAINAIESCMDIPGCMKVEEIREVTLEDEHLSVLTELALHSWLSTKTEVLKKLHLY